MSLVDKNLVAFGFRHLLKSKKFWAAVAVSAVPILAGLLLIFTDAADARRVGDDFQFRPDFTEWVAFFAIGGTIPLISLLLAGGLLADEAQDRTLTYLLVRPIPRATLYISKFIPVAVILGGLVAAQILIFGLLRLLSLVMQDSGARMLIADGSADVSVAALLAVTIPAGMAIGVLVAWAYCALFALVSLLFQRFHFLVNLLVFLVWELPFGTIGGGGVGFLTILYHGQSFIGRIDPTIDGFTDGAAHPALAAVWLIGTIALWLWVGAWRIRKQDFHITSAAT